MASIQSIDKCPKCGSSTEVVGWYHVRCTNPNCIHSQDNNLISDGDIFHD